MKHVLQISFIKSYERFIYFFQISNHIVKGSDWDRIKNSAIP